jgi:hypothetical protein
MNIRTIVVATCATLAAFAGLTDFRKKAKRIRSRRMSTRATLVQIYPTPN